MGTTPDFKLRMYTIPFDDRNGEKTEKLINEAAIVARLAHTLLTPTEGVRINGLKYIPVRTFPNGTENDGLGTIHLKRIFGGGCICVTKKALVMATFDEGKGQTATQCNLYVERAGRYLLNQEY